MLTPTNIKCIREFEKLHDRYLASKNKKELMIKKVFAIDTYVLYAVNEWVVMAQIAHNRTNKDIGEICTNLIEDAKMEEESAFLLSHL